MRDPARAVAVLDRAREARAQSRYQAVGSARGKRQCTVAGFAERFFFQPGVLRGCERLEPQGTELHVMAGAQRGGEQVALVAARYRALVERVGAAGVVLVAAGGERGVHVQPPVEPAGVDRPRRGVDVAMAHVAVDVGLVLDRAETRAGGKAVGQAAIVSDRRARQAVVVTVHAFGGALIALLAESAQPQARRERALRLARLEQVGQALARIGQTYRPAAQGVRGLRRGDVARAQRRHAILQHVRVLLHAVERAGAVAGIHGRAHAREGGGELRIRQRLDAAQQLIQLA